MKIIQIGTGTTITTDETVTVLDSVPTPAPVPAPAPAPSPAPAPAPTGASVATVTGTLSDGTAISVSVPQGSRVPLIAGSPHGGSAIFHADGLSICLENCYEGLTGDLAGTFTVSAGGAQLFSGPLTVWAYTRTHPFWVKPAAVNPAADLSMFPKYGPGAETVSMAAEYAKADNSPMSVSLWTPGMANTGERADLGPLDQFSATYIKSPSAENAVVLRGLADAASVYPFHCIDFTTGKMVSLAGNPKTSLLGALLGVYGNTIAKYTSACPQNLSEAAAHAPTFCALSAAVFGTDYDKEELALWANYVGGMYQNWSYRLPDGCCSSASGQTRGKGRALTTVLYASKLSDNSAYFAAWAQSVAADMSAVFPKQIGLEIDQFNAVYNNSTGFAPYQQHILIEAIGRGLDFGFTGFQPALDYFATYLLDSLLTAQHELATIYSVYYKNAAGTIATNWTQALQFSAANDPHLTASLLTAEGSQALQTAMGWTDQPGDFHGYPTAPDGFPALLQGALVAVAKHATDQTRAQAAWAKFKQYGLPRIDYSQNPKYNIVP